MSFLSWANDCLVRVLRRKKTLLLFAVIYLAGIILGFCFIKTPAIYRYHLNLCERFVDRVCYSDRNVFVIFGEHILSAAIPLALLLLCGLHVVGLAFPPFFTLFRAYVFGGSVTVFFSVYRVSGALVVFALYAPIRLLTDAVFVAATTLSCERAPCFHFCKPDFFDLCKDAIVLFAVLLGICFLEMILLLVLFHPIGSFM